MHTRLIAIGERQPSWVDEGFRVYSSRLPHEWKFRLDCIGTRRRSKKESSSRARTAESAQILKSLRRHERMVLLDENGIHLDSKELAGRLTTWQSDGRDVCFVIGGPDGVSIECRERADFVWSLSKLTLPHGLARILVAEQLYRASSLAAGHPYHRD